MCELDVPASERIFSRSIPTRTQFATQNAAKEQNNSLIGYVLCHRMRINFHKTNNTLFIVH